MAVLKAFITSVTDGSLLKNVVASLLRVVEGFLACINNRGPLGVVMGISRIVYGLVDPLLELLRPIPPIAVIPLAILWFGIDELSKVFIIAYGAFFPILVNTLAGFREVERASAAPKHWERIGITYSGRRAALRISFIIVGARLA